MTRLPLLVLVLVALVAVAGCGSSKTSSSTSAPKVTPAQAAAARAAKFKADWTEQSAQLKQLGITLAQELNSAQRQTDAVVIANIKGLSEKAHAAVTKLGVLSPPAAEKGDVTALASALDKAAGDLDTIAASAAVKKFATVKTATASLVRDSVPVKTLHQKIDTAVGR